MMILRKWAAVAACMVAIGGPACAQSTGDPQQGQSQEQNSNSKQREAGTPQSHISLPPSHPQRADKSPTQAEVYEPNCAQPKSQPDADLCVQRRVADAAENALHWTKIQTWGALVGLALVLATLGVTAWTGKAATIAAQAAIDAVGAERAWVAVDSFDVNGARNLTVDGVFHQIGYITNIGWINSGRSPAINLDVYTILKDVPKDAPPPDFIVPEKPSVSMAGVMGPGLKASSNHFAIVGETFEKLGRQEIDLYIYSRATYEIVSAPNVVKYTEFCAKIEQNGRVADQSGIMSPRFTLAVCGPNSAT